MTNITTDQPLAVPRFRIGQDVHLKTGGPEMVVNRCTQGPDGDFIIDTIWFGMERNEEHGTYLEKLLDGQDMRFFKI